MADLVGYDDAAGTHNVVASCSGKSGISIRAFWAESARIEVHRGVNSYVIHTFRTDSNPAQTIIEIFADQIIMHIFAVDYLGPSGFCYHEEQTSFLEGCSFSFSKQPSPTRWPIRSGISWTCGRIGPVILSEAKDLSTNRHPPVIPHPKIVMPGSDRASLSLSVMPDLIGHLYFGR